MATIILFGGGDAGGLIIGPNGVRPIPPFDPRIRKELRGLSALLNGQDGLSQKARVEMAKLTNRAANLLVGELESIVGSMEGEHSFIYQDEDGGFTCGSTGKPPIPFPWPPSPFPDIDDLIAAGVLERELVDFIQLAVDKKKPIARVLEDPATAAGELGVRLSQRVLQDLEQLAPSKAAKIKDPVTREVVQFFHKVAEDGRFITTWATRPYEVSKQLKLELSEEAAGRILGAGSISGRGGSVMNPGIAIVVVIVVMLVPTEAGRGQLVVRDSSGKRKF